MVASAMGRSRTDSIDDLTVLRFGVRKDQDGRILTDFHMAHSANDSNVTRRQYISDAVFLAGLEGDISKLMEIETALSEPAYPLFLGRRSCPPTGKISLGIHEGTLEEVLSNFEWQASDWYRRRKADKVRLEIITDCQDGILQLNDMPLSFDQRERRFRRRNVRRWFSDKIIDNPLGKRQNRGSDHDGLAVLREME